MIKIKPLFIPDVVLIEPQVFNDERGFFFESFNQKEFNEVIRQKITFVQDNHSRSFKNVIRGLHYQEEPFQQAKLVRVIYGEVWDVAVDIRKNSPTYGLWVSEILSAKNKKQLWIPEGFAHGFCVLSEFAELTYKVNQYYSKEHEKTINWKDNKFKIEWPIDNTKAILSLKDKNF